MQQKKSNSNSERDATKQKMSSLRRTFSDRQKILAVPSNTGARFSSLKNMLTPGGEPDQKPLYDVPEIRQESVKPSWAVRKASGFVLIMAITAVVIIQSMVSTHSSTTIDTLESAAPNASSTRATDMVSSLGRVEPSGEIVRISPPSTMPGDRVAKLFVEEGDQLKKGQLIAVLTSAERARAACQESEARVRLARAHLNQVKAGSHRGDIDAQAYRLAKTNKELIRRVEEQKATEKRLKAHLDFAEREYGRYKTLGNEGAVSASMLDTKYCDLVNAREQHQEAVLEEQRLQETLNSQMAEESSTLKRLREVRPVDIAVAEAEVDSALAALNHAKQEYDLCFIRAPKDGRVLKIVAHAGEAATENGIIELGETDQMIVIADVYESDVDKVRVGAQATITSDALPFMVKGRVSQIGWKVTKQHVFSTDPRQNMDNRVVEVRIKLDKEESKKLTRFTELQVQVNIEA
jgi:HlyD family secretion protein